MLILYPATFLNLLIRSSSFCMESLCFFIYSIMSSTYIDSLLWFLTSLLLMCYITLIDLHMLNHLCELGINPNLVVVYNLLYVLLVWFASILGMFVFILIKDFGL